MDQALFNSLASFVGGSEPWKANPFSVKVNGRITWSVATDGCWLVAVKGGSLKPLEEPKPKVVEVLSSKVVEPAYEIDVGRLREWAGKPPEVWDFEDEDLDQDLGVIFDVVIDRCRLSCLLTKVPFDTIRIWNSTSAVGVRSIGLEAEGWRVILAGIDTSPDDPIEEGEGPLPVFVLRPKSVFEMAMDLEENEGA